MAAKIKLQRKGTSKKPVYRVIVQDESASTSGQAIKILGKYNPRAGQNIFEVNKKEVSGWIAKGALPTEKVRILLGKAGILSLVSFEGKPKRKPRKEAKKEPPAPKEEPKKEEKKAEEKPPAQKPQATEATPANPATELGVKEESK